MKTQPAIYHQYDGTRTTCEVTNIREHVSGHTQRRYTVGDLVITLDDKTTMMLDFVPQGMKPGYWELLDLERQAVLGGVA